MNDIASIPALIPAFCGVSGLALLAYISASPRVAEALYLKDMFEPVAYPGGAYDDHILEGVRAQDIYFSNDKGQKMHGWYFHLAGADKTILLSHGSAGNIADLQILLSLLLRSNCSVFAYDYRGFGRSQGKPTVNGVCEDAVYAFDFLVNELKVPAEKIVLYGESVGGAVACQLATKRPCKGLILQSAFKSLRQAAIDMFPPLVIYPTALFPKPFMHSADILAKHKFPVLILHGAKDNNIKPKHAIGLMQKAQGPKKLVFLPHTVHEDIAEADWDLFTREIKEYLQTI